MTRSTEVPSEKQNSHSSSYMLNAETPYTPIFVRPISTLFISLPNQLLSGSAHLGDENSTSHLFLRSIVLHSRKHFREPGLLAYSFLPSSRCSDRA